MSSRFAFLVCFTMLSAACGSGGPADAAASAGAAVTRAACATPEHGVLQEVVGSAVGPYFVHHPDEGVTDPDTILFIPGGPGSRETANATFELWLSRGSTLGKFRVVVPYSADGNLLDEGSRFVAVLDDVLSCYGGSAARVHLAGTSNGGRAAYALMLASPGRFISLLGAPGLFDVAATDAEIATALAGKPILNAAGELDASWKPRVEATQARLLRLGLTSSYVELAGQGHILSSSADQEPFFAFWRRP